MINVVSRLKCFNGLSRHSCNIFIERNLSTSFILYRLGGWRLRNKLPARGREYGPLTDLPDWSYADGRPAPLSQGAKNRILLHKSYCEQIIKLTKEVDKCFELNKQKAATEKMKREGVIKNRLKTKGKTEI